MKTLPKRIAQSLVGILLGIDMTVQSALWAIPYAINPAWGFDARFTISGRFGTMAAKGWRFGIIGAAFIDDIPCFGPGHCARAARTDDLLIAAGI